MMQGIAQDFVKYVMHAQVAVAEQPAQQAELGNVQYTAPTDPSDASISISMAVQYCL